MESQFWADKKAFEIYNKRNFKYLSKEAPDFKKHVIKTSASISGVLHIGRLSDTIRSETVYQSLLDSGNTAELIWVAEDMDPLRKIPEGISKKFKDYLGMPVIDVPDPWGCHNSYAAHHITEYFDVIHEFVNNDLIPYSMKDEYKKGNFKPFISKLLKNLSLLIQIQNKYRKTPLRTDWSPWIPTCKNCGKIITSRIKKFEDNILTYKCEDYLFEKTRAKGCGYEGEASPLKDKGKLMWKGEWAAQWKRWKITSEGAGKEYVVPYSAWWVNAEIVERILDHPMPIPIFYEHIMVNGKKMSASIGNVVYPKEWLSVASPQLLRFYYNKKLMKTRSFSWHSLPNLYDEYDRHSSIYQKGGSDKSTLQKGRLFEISQLQKIDQPFKLSFSHAAFLSQMFFEEKEIIASLRRSGHYDKDNIVSILKRIKLASNWVENFAPLDMKRKDIKINILKETLNKKQRKFLGEISAFLSKDREPDEIHEKIYSLSKDLDIQTGKAFQCIYLAVVGKKTGPKAGNLLSSLDKKWIVQRFMDIAEL
jgi:lysyl-tRNA synthetase class 1